MKTKLSIEQIENLATELIMFCARHKLGDTIVYYNNKRTFIDYNCKIRTEPADVHDYLEYAGDILSMSFEGTLYELINGYYPCKHFDSILEELHNIVHKYGLFYEMGNSWNFSLYPIP